MPSPNPEIRVHRKAEDANHGPLAEWQDYWENLLAGMTDTEGSLHLQHSC